MTAVDEIDAQPPARIRWFAVVSLVGHVGLLAIGAASLWRIGDGWWIGALVALLFVLLYATMWRFWLAPGSKLRRGYRERFTITLVIVPLTVVLGALAQLWLPALVAGSFVMLGDALNERRN